MATLTVYVTSGRITTIDTPESMGIMVTARR